MIFGIVERQRDRRKILALILSIKLCYEEKVKILLSCSIKTKEYIENFADLQNIEIIYLLSSPDNNMSSLDKFYNLIYLGVMKYGECLFIDTTLIMTNKIIINEEIKNQGIGIVKFCSVGSHIEEHVELLKYSSHLLYVSKMEHVLKIKEYIDYHNNLDLQDISNNDLSNNYILNNDISNNDVSNNDVSNDDVSNDDVSNNDASNNDVLNNDVSNNDISNNDVSNNYASNNDVLNNDVSNNDVSNNDDDVSNIFKLHIDASGNETLKLNGETVKQDNVKINKENKKINKFSLPLPNYLNETIKINNYFESYTLLAIREFLGFTNTIKLNDLRSDGFCVKENQVKFLCLDDKKSHIPEIGDVLMAIVKPLLHYNYKFVNVINLRGSNGIDLVSPIPNGFNEWDRTEDISGGMFELIEMLSNVGYYSLRKNVDIDHFLAGSYILMDKNSNTFLTRKMRKWQLFLCNYSEKMKKTLDNLNHPYKFLCYYSEHPKILEDFTQDKIFDKTIDYVEIKNDKIHYYVDNKLIEKKVSLRNSDYEGFLVQLENVKFGLIETLDIHLISTFLSLNICPIIQNDLPLFELEENVHYLNAVNLSKYDELVVNIKEYVKNNIKIKGVSNKILNVMFTN